VREVISFSTRPSRKFARAVKTVSRVIPPKWGLPSIERTVDVHLPEPVQRLYLPFGPQDTSDQHDVRTTVSAAIVKIRSQHRHVCFDCTRQIYMQGNASWSPYSHVIEIGTLSDCFSARRIISHLLGAAGNLAGVAGGNGSWARLAGVAGGRYGGWARVVGVAGGSRHQYYILSH
jgi:hypothetical protein